LLPGLPRFTGGTFKITELQLEKPEQIYGKKV